MNKKSITIIMLIVVILVAIIICTTFLDNEKSENNENEIIEDDTSPNAFCISYEGVNITPGVTFDENSLPEDHGFAEVESYAFDGQDKVYTYENVEIIVANVNEEEIVYSVYLLNENIETEEGVKISDSMMDMTNAYGENYENEELNSYTYIQEENSITFIIENEVITSIKYTLTNTEDA